MFSYSGASKLNGFLNPEKSLSAKSKNYTSHSDLDSFKDGSQYLMSVVYLNDMYLAATLSG